MALSVESYGSAQVRGNTALLARQALPQKRKSSAPVVSSSKPQAAVYTPSKTQGNTQAKYKSTYTAQGAYANTSSQKNSPSAVSVAKNFGVGVVDAGKCAVDGVVQTFRNPVQTAKAVGNVVTHPVQTAEAIKGVAVGAWGNFKEGDADVKARMIGRLTGEVGLALVGTKCADKAVKAVQAVRGAKAAGAAADLGKLQKLADRATDAVDKLGQEAYTSAQKKAIKNHPRLEPAYRGTAIDIEFKELVSKDKKLGNKYTPTEQGKAGPDLIHKQTGEWVDITTEKQAQKHIDKYTPIYGKGYIVTHK